jgi:hypothetical protein
VNRRIRPNRIRRSVVESAAPLTDAGCFSNCRRSKIKRAGMAVIERIVLEAHWVNGLETSLLCVSPAVEVRDPLLRPARVRPER